MEETRKLKLVIELDNVTKERANAYLALAMEFLRDDALIDRIAEEFLVTGLQSLRATTDHYLRRLDPLVKHTLRRGGIYTQEQLMEAYQADEGIRWYYEPYSRKPFGCHGLGEKRLLLLGTYMVNEGLCTTEEFASRYSGRFGISDEYLLKLINSRLDWLDQKKG